MSNEANIYKTGKVIRISIFQNPGLNDGCYVTFTADLNESVAIELLNQLEKILEVE